jgi:hypothetical protein
MLLRVPARIFPRADRRASGGFVCAGTGRGQAQKGGLENDGLYGPQTGRQNGLENIVNRDETIVNRADETVPSDVTMLRRWLVCERMHIRSRETCSRDCLRILASFNDFTTLQFILANARWAGAPSQEQMQREYLQERMWAAVRRLPHSEDLLVQTLCEIIEEVEGWSSGSHVSTWKPE